MNEIQPLIYYYFLRQGRPFIIGTIADLCPLSFPWCGAVFYAKDLKSSLFLSKKDEKPTKYIIIFWDYADQIIII